MAGPLIFDTNAGQARFGAWIAAFSFGKNGTIPEAQGREGDGKTPLGAYHLRFGFYRADRLPRPKSDLTFHAVKPDDGWCDDPDHPAYNRLIQTPFPASHEALWREDGAYDVILVMSHNDSPPVPGLGSAVFIHCLQPDHRSTLGCLALSPPDMWTLLPKLTPGLAITVV